MYSEATATAALERGPPHLPRAARGDGAPEPRRADVLRPRQEDVRDVPRRPPRRRAPGDLVRRPARRAGAGHRAGADALLPPAVRRPTRLARRAARPSTRTGTRWRRSAPTPTVGSHPRRWSPSSTLATWARTDDPPHRDVPLEGGHHALTSPPSARRSVGSRRRSPRSATTASATTSASTTATSTSSSWPTSPTPTTTSRTADHPLHRALVSDRIAPHVAERAAVQFDID